MTQSIGLSENYDIYKDASGNMPIVRGRDAAVQNCTTAISAQLNEMVYATGDGMPMQDTAFDRYDPIGFETAARAVLLKVPDVLDVVEFVITRQESELIYLATILTVYGEVQIGSEL